MINTSNFGGIISKYNDASNAAQVYRNPGDNEENKTPGGEVELEIRFGKYSPQPGGESGFESGVEYYEYMRLYNEYKANEDFVPNVSLDDVFQLTTNPSPFNQYKTNVLQYRRTTYIGDSEEDNIEKWIIKHKKGKGNKFEFNDYNFRLGIAVEEHLSNEDFESDDEGVIFHYQGGDDPDELKFVGRREKTRNTIRKEDEEKGNEVHMTTVEGYGKVDPEDGAE